MTGSTSTVDAVVPTIGRPSLAVVLRALADPRQPVVGRVVVVDDRSHADGPLHDDINEIGNRLDVEVIRDPVRGPAAARTVGWRRASTGWAAFLDDDDVPPPDWATGLAADLAAMEADPAVVGVQGRIVLPLPTQRRPTDWERSVAGLEHARSAAADLVAVGRRLAGEWRARRVGRGHRPAEAVLFDRDGTVIVDVPYNGDPDRVAPVAGAAALDELRRAGLQLGIVTNQSGVARGVLDVGAVEAVNRRVISLLGPFDTVEVCAHGPDEGCPCRKPRAGLVLRAAISLGVEPEACVVVGDIGADVEAAVAAGARAVLVPTAVTRREEVAAARAHPTGRIAVGPDLAAACRHVLEGWR
jgi:histidinol-phosphate phosphatase family protein